MRRIAACVVLLGVVRSQETGLRCVNRIDDDADGLIDCLDPDCASNPVCYLAARAGGEGGADGADGDGEEACVEDPQGVLNLDASAERVICQQAIRLLRGANDRDCTVNARAELAELQNRPAVMVVLVATGQQIDLSAVPEGLDMAALCPCACATEPPSRGESEPGAGGHEAAGAGDDSCDQAHDGFCDEPYECDTGTDTTDCSQEGFEGGNNPYCRYASDGECDEVQYCPAGSDTRDCCLNGAPRAVDPSGRAVMAADVCCGGDCVPPARDSCQFANDGECDEPVVGTAQCPRGSDTTDCANTQTTCPWTGDGECDEGMSCDAGSDTADCCLNGRPRVQDAAGNPIVPSDVSCPAGGIGDGRDGNGGGGSRGGRGSRGGGSRGGGSTGRGGAGGGPPLCDDGSRPACASGARPGPFGCPDGTAPVCADGTVLSQSDGATCDIRALMANCAGANLETFGSADEDIDIDELCENPCINSLIPCSSNPMIATMMGADEARGIAALRPLCAPTPADATGPDDGICDMRALFDLCGDGQVGEECEEDMACFCASGCALEMMDCAESPAMAQEREDVLVLQAVCNEPEGAAGEPGDGICSLRQASTLCDEDELEQMDVFEELEAREERNQLPYYNCDAPPDICVSTFGTRHETFDPSDCCQCLGQSGDEDVCPPRCLQVDAQCHGVLACEGVCTELEDGDLAELMELQEEMCAHPCVMELIDCSTSRLLPREERAELVELRVACGAHTPAGTPPPPVVAQLELLLAVDIAGILPGTPERYAFERRFKSDVARAANVLPQRVVLDGVRQGSVVVTFHITEPMTTGRPASAAAVSSDDAIAALQSALSTGTVLVVGEVIPADALVVRDEATLRSPLSSASSEPGAAAVAPDDKSGDGVDVGLMVLAAGGGAAGVLLLVAVVTLCQKKRMKLGPVDGGRVDAAVAFGYVEHQEAGPVGVQTNALAVDRNDSQVAFKNGSLRP